MDYGCVTVLVQLEVAPQFSNSQNVVYNFRQLVYIYTN